MCVLDSVRFTSEDGDYFSLINVTRLHAMSLVLSRCLGAGSSSHSCFLETVAQLDWIVTAPPGMPVSFSGRVKDIIGDSGDSKALVA